MKYRITPERPGFKFPSRYIEGDQVKVSQTINRIMQKYEGRPWTAPYTVDVAVARDGMGYVTTAKHDVRTQGES